MKENIYKNILVIVSGLLVFYFFFKVFRERDIAVLMYISVGIGVFSIAIPAFARLLNFLWMKLALALGWINSRILLSIVFYVFLFPLAIVSRLFTKDPMKLKNKSDSIYEDRSHLYVKEDIENIW